LPVHLITWVLRTENIEETIANALNKGYNPGMINRGFRVKPNGDKIAWSAAISSHKPIDLGKGIIPFLIQWEDMSLHPSKTDDPYIQLKSFRAGHPEHERVNQVIHALGASHLIHIEYAQNPYLIIELDSPRGNITISSHIDPHQFSIDRVNDMEENIRDIHLKWMNYNYNNINFNLSHFQDHILFIGKCNGTRIAHGRLVRIESEIKCYELGGILVLEPYRRYKIASKLVNTIMSYALSLQFDRLYCIPFSYLISFYCQFGFREASPEELNESPPYVKEKMVHCSECHKEKRVELLIYK